MKRTKKNIITVIAVLAVILWSFAPTGVFFMSKIAKAAPLTSVTVVPNADNVDNLIGQSSAIWKFTVNNVTALTALSTAVEIAFPAEVGNFTLADITATSTATDGDAITFATTSLPVINTNKVRVMVLTNQTSANNDFTINISGVTNPIDDTSRFTTPLSWSVGTCTLAVAGNPASDCTNLDSTIVATAQLRRRGGAITVGSLTAASAVASITTEYTISFTASSTLSAGEQIWIHFPSDFNINNATTSAQADINGAGTGSPQVAADAIATSSAYLLNAVVLTTSNAGIAAGDTVTVKTGNIVNPAKGSYTGVRFFTTTANGGLVDGSYQGLDQEARQFGPPPVESLQIGGTNTITGTVKVRNADGTLRTVTAEEAAQMQVGMGCPDLMFYVGTVQVASNGTFTYNNVLDATYILFVQPFSETSSFFESLVSPNMIMVTVTGDETVTLTPTFEVPDSFIAGTVTGGPANYNSQTIEIRAYTAELQTYDNLFNSVAYTTSGLDASGVGYFQIPVKSGNTWKINFETNNKIMSGTNEYWTPSVTSVYVPDTSTVTTTAAFVLADKELRVTLRNSSNNSLITSNFCISVRRTGQEMMGPMMGNEICNATGDYYSITVPTGQFAIQTMAPGRGFKEYPVLIDSSAATTTKTIIVESPSQYITGTVTDPDSFPIQGVSVFAQSNTGNFNEAMTNSSGVYTIYVPPGTYTVRGFTPGYGPLTPITGIVVTNGVNQTGKNFSISAANFKTIQGQVYTDVNTNNAYNAGIDTPYQGVQIYAYGASGGNGTQTRSDGSYTLRVPAGSGYTIGGWHEDIGDLTPIISVDVSSSNATGQDFKVGATGYLQIRITNGNVASLSPVFAGAFNSSNGKGNGSDSFTATTSDPSFTNIDDLVTKFSLPAGTYNVRVGTPAYGELTDLSANSGARTATITAGAITDLTLTLPTLYTISGTAAASANVWASRIDGPGKFNATADSSGNYSMKLPAGTYMIGANLTGYLSTPQSTTVSANATINITLTASAATISGTVSSGGTALTEGFVWAVKASNQGWLGTEINANGSYSLEVDEGTWIVYAAGPCYYDSLGTSQTGSGTVNISLTSISGCTFEAPETQSIVPASGGKISQSDVEVTIPAYALGDGSSAVTVSVSKPSTVPPTTLNAAPLTNAAQTISATNSSGTAISSLNSSVKIVLSYSDSDIPNGSSENNLQLAYWNTTSSAWEPVAATLDTTNNTLTASVTHFTDFAPILPTGDDVPATPTGLAASLGSPANSVIQLSWTQVSGASGYYIYRDTSSSGNFPLLATISSGSTTSLTNSELNSGVNYFYKITAYNDNGESAASSAVAKATEVPSAGSGGSSSSSGGIPATTPAVPAVTTPAVATESAPAPQSSLLSSAPVETDGSVVAKAATGGQASLITDSGTTAQVIIPSAAIAQDTTVAVETVKVTKTTTGGDLASGGTSVVPATPTGSAIVGGQTYNISATTSGGAAVSSFADSLTISFGYTNSQIAGINESTLAVYYYNDTIDSWIKLDSTVDTVNHLVKAYVDHLTTFAVMGSLIADMASYNGKVVKAANSNAVYLVNNGYRRPFTSEMMYFSYGYNWSDVVVMDVNTIPQGPNMVYSDDNVFTAGQMVKGTNEKVYFIDNLGYRHWVESESVYLGLGYDWKQVAWISDIALAKYAEGSTISSANLRPNGSLVKYQGNDKVYLIDGAKKRWIVNEAVFNNHNYGWYNIITIPTTETYSNGSNISL